MNKSEIEQLAGRLLAGDLSVEEFSRQIRHCGIANVGDAQLDLDRGRRCGFPEVVYSQGKTVAALEKIFDALLEHGVHVLATRMAPDQAAELLPRFARPVQSTRPDVPYSHRIDKRRRAKWALAGVRPRDGCHRRNE